MTKYTSSPGFANATTKRQARILSALFGGMLAGSLIIPVQGQTIRRPVDRQQTVSEISKEIAPALANPKTRGRQMFEHQAKATRSRLAAMRKAREGNWPEMRPDHPLEHVELIGLSDTGFPIYISSLAANATISAGAIELHGANQDFLTGEGVKVAVLDTGFARLTHQEFNHTGTPRVTSPIENPYPNAHATAVASVVAGGGLNAEVLGTAPQVNVVSDNFYPDLAKMTEMAAATPIDFDKIQTSNHSYGSIAGWQRYYSGGTHYWYWYGEGWKPDGTGFNEDPNFGRYDDIAAGNDAVVYGAPYYLPVRAAGNDRSDSYNGKKDGTGTFRYFDGSTWAYTYYDAATAPVDEKVAGYDTILRDASAKNILTVGAVTDAVTNGERDTSVASMTHFSAWGPTDDGRIKPDVVANGATVRMASSSGDANYLSGSGTSFAAPAVTGVSALLQDEAQDLYPHMLLRASTLKALLIHGATDIGNPGPDYQNGWGHVDAAMSVDILVQQALEPEAFHLVEGLLDEKNPTDEFPVAHGGAEDLIATIVWTDPAGQPRPVAVDDRTPMLVNDLDLRIIAPDGTAYYPFVLDPENPTNNATTGDNTVDNVEQVRIPAGSATAGTYTVAVSHKGLHGGGEQWYSLTMSGQTVSPMTPPPTVDSVSPSSALEGSSLAMEIDGQSFELGTMFKLRDDSGMTIDSSLSYSAHERLIGQVALGDCTPGKLDLLVVEPDGSVTTYEDVFEIKGRDPVTILSENFESGDYSNWESASRLRMLRNHHALDGDFSVQLSGLDKMTQTLNVAGLDELTISYLMDTERLDQADVLYVEFSTDNGQTWTTVDQVQGDLGYQTRTASFPALNGAETMKLRFRCDFYRRPNVTIDNIVIIGLPTV